MHHLLDRSSSSYKSLDHNEILLERTMTFIFKVLFSFIISWNETLAQGFIQRSFLLLDFMQQSPLRKRWQLTEEYK